MKFACDVMLGRLARWLRISGLDVFYDNRIDRSSLFRVAREQGRIIITRAGTLRELKDIPPYLIITGDDLDDQLAQVYGNFPDLDPFADFLSRCVECNVPLEEIEKQGHSQKIPPKAMLTQGPFSRCPSCGKILWQGAHVGRMTERLKGLAGRVGKRVP